MLKITCLIAAYNENPRIVEVLKTVTRCKLVSEIICVDDGSIDGTGDLVKREFKNVRLIQHKTNKGKVEAIRSGTDTAEGDTLLLLDADYVGLNSTEIEKAINLFELNNLDCLLLLTRPMNFGYKLFRNIFRITSCVTGARIIRKSILQNVLNDKSIKGYELEVLQNKYLIENNLSVATFKLTAVDLGKTEKSGLITGTVKEMTMWQQIISRVGLLFLARLSFSFATRLLN